MYVSYKGGLGSLGKFTVFHVGKLFNTTLSRELSRACVHGLGFATLTLNLA